jgi:hypothetical protein
MVDLLEVRPLLDGVRGRPPADVEAPDANPIICGASACVAVDAL